MKRNIGHEEMMPINRLAMLALCTALPLVAAPVAAADLYAAIAFSPSTGKSGAAWNFDSEAAALGEAVQQCAVDDCASVTVFGQCGALAVGDGYGMGFAANLSTAVANDEALANCNGFTTNCEITLSLCNEGS